VVVYVWTVQSRAIGLRDKRRCDRATSSGWAGRRWWLVRGVVRGALSRRIEVWSVLALGLNVRWRGGVCRRR